MTLKLYLSCRNTQNDLTKTRSRYTKNKVEELEEPNQSIRSRDKMKDDDAIVQLSDQLLAISIRLQELGRKQQPYQ